MPHLLWQPTQERIAQSALRRFWNDAQEHTGRTFQSYADLHAWSVEQYQDFWAFLLAWSGLTIEGSSTPAVQSPSMPGAQFFPNLTLNFAENLLAKGNAQHTAVVSLSESRPEQRLTYAELRVQVARAAQSLRELGIKPGDVIAGFVPNAHEALIAMLATATVGATWTSCSPDFGQQGVLDRFGQVAPRVLFAANGYQYNGKRFDCTEKVQAIAAALPSVERVVVFAFLHDHPMPKFTGKLIAWDDFLAPGSPALSFTRVPFNQPLYVMYSSGTTGIPKCIVHGVGGTLLQHFKELVLHTNLTTTSRITYFTTCGWMMWNWLASSLVTGCSMYLYDGSPSYPDMGALWRLAQEHELTHFGTSAKFLGSCRGNVTPKELGLPKLTTILSTGSPLLPEDFDWVYSHVKADVMLASISGGTDIISCFMLGNPTLPVYRGEIQAFGLGMDVVALSDAGKPVLGEKGELACRTPFVSMPVAFWNDPDGEKYRKAYFDRVPNTWVHGDFVEVTGTVGAVGGVVVYGRSDATLNPGGVRIGTAEIYRLVETLPEIEDALVIGQPWQGDVRVVLFVKLKGPTALDERLQDRIKKTIRQGATPRHVPGIIVAVPKVPYTMSGKKTELAVLQIVCGEEPKNKEALADAAALDGYRNLAALR